MFKRLAERKEQGRLLAQYKRDASQDNIDVYAPLLDKYVCEVKKHVLDELLVLIEKWNKRVKEINDNFEVEIREAEASQDYRAQVIAEHKKNPARMALQAEFDEKFKVLDGVLTLLNRAFYKETQVRYDSWKNKYRGLFKSVERVDNKALWALHDCEEASKQIRKDIEKLRLDVSSQLSKALECMGYGHLSEISTHNNWSRKGHYFWLNQG